MSQPTYKQKVQALKAASSRTGRYVCGYIDAVKHAAIVAGHADAEVARLRADLVHYWTLIVHEGAVERKAGAWAGWWDCSVAEDVQEVADWLVAAGLWERHPNHKHLYREVGL